MFFKLSFCRQKKCNFHLEFIETSTVNNQQFYFITLTNGDNSVQTLVRCGSRFDIPATPDLTSFELQKYALASVIALTMKYSPKLDNSAQCDL